jgi:hypothetical protein
MPAYSGKFQYEGQSGACEVSFDAERFVLTPAAGVPVAVDLGDIDRFAPADWDLTLTLYTGRTVALRQFGSTFGRMVEELLAAWRDRTVQCLLLEDLEEIDRFDGIANGSRAEIRLYGSNLAVLPLGADPVQMRLADLDSVSFDEATYTVGLDATSGRVALSKLAKRTDEFRGKLAEALDVLRKRTASVLHGRFAFLDPDRLRQLMVTMPEGRSAEMASLAAIDARLPEALIQMAVDEDLKPYFDELRGRSGGSWHAGFKFVRPEEDQSAEEELFFWFFLPLEGKDVVAWEATTGTGRATYFFRDQATVEQITRGLGLINFRREPVYLPEESLAQQPRYRRYAIGARKLPDLRVLRGAFLGRAIHSSLEEWVEQVRRFA